MKSKGGEALDMASQEIRLVVVNHALLESALYSTRYHAITMVRYGELHEHKGFGLKPMTWRSGMYGGVSLLISYPLLLPASQNCIGLLCRPLLFFAYQIP